MNLFGLGAPELLLIFFVLLVFFGKDKLPGLARSVGQSFNELKKGFASEISDHDSKHDSKDTKDTKSPKKKA